MAPKPKSEGKAKAEKTDGPTLQLYCDALTQAVKVNGVLLSKTHATIELWSLALSGKKQRDDINKAGCVPIFQSMVEKGSTEERHAGMGALHAMMQSEELLPDIATTKVFGAAAAMLTGDHDRSRLPAVQLLHAAATQPDYVTKVGELALPALCSSLQFPSPGWAQCEQVARCAAATVKLLIENTEYEPPGVHEARRLYLIQQGIIPHLIHLLAYEPRPPPPLEVPAPLPPIPKKPKKKSSKHGPPPPAPLGHKDAAATEAAACLRFLSLSPEFVMHLLDPKLIRPFVNSLTTATPQQAAYVCGVLWEVTSESSVAKAVAQCGALRPLLHVISSNFLAVLSKSGGKKKAAKNSDGKDKDAAKKKALQAILPPAPDYPDIAICNAAGALHHLTFVDDVKRQAPEVAHCIPILVAALKLKNPQTFENATGALWNLGLEVRNRASLKEAGAPGYLTAPVPVGWLVIDGSDEEEDSESSEEEDEEHPHDNLFLTNMKV